MAEDSFYAPDAPPSWDARQKTFVDHLFDGCGHDRSHVTSLDGLRAAVRRQDWPDKRSGKLIELRYQTLGPLLGRDTLLRRLRESLERGRGQAAIVGRAMHGLGGVGKTRAAVEYAWWRRR